MLDGLRADASQAADEEENAAAALDNVAEFELALSAAQSAAARPPGRPPAGR